MIKMHYSIILSLCFITLCILLASCDSSFKHIFNKAVKATEKMPQSSTALSTVDTEGFRSYNRLDSASYKQYEKKIWVAKNWAGDSEAYLYPFSFTVMKIENAALEGRFYAGSIAMPPCYEYSIIPNSTFTIIEYLPDLHGKIINGVAKCQFESRNGEDSGSITLVFKEKDSLEATIEFNIKKYGYENEPPDGEYIFRPYNLSDITHTNTLKKQSYKIDLDSWGSVNLVTVVRNIKEINKPFPSVYLTNEHDDILYKFGASFPTGSEIIEVAIEDVNGDGLKDVKMVAGFYDYETSIILSDTPLVERIYFQMGNGLFYDSRLNIK